MVSRVEKGAGLSGRQEKVSLSNITVKKVPLFDHYFWNSTDVETSDMGWFS